MQLSELGHQVMAVDRDEERVNECMDFVTNAQIGDSTRVDFLRSLGVGNYDVCYVTISGDFQNSLETTSLLKELGAKYVVSRAERDVQAKFLLRNGADAVTYPEKQLAKWAAIRYTANHIFSYIELGEKHAIIEVAVPDSWQGHSIGELDIRRKYGVNILGVKRNDKTDVNISPETVLDSSLTLLVLGGVSRSAVLVLAGMLIMGVCYGNSVTIGTLVIRQFYGSAHYATNLAIVNCCAIPASFIGPLISSALQTASGGDYTTTFVCVLVFAVADLLVGFLVKKP